MARRNVGSVREYRPGMWLVRVQRGRTPDGRPRVVCRTVEGTEGDARAAAAAIAADLGERGALPRVTLGEYWRAVFPTRPSNRGTPRSPATMRYYSQVMERDVLPTLGDVPLSEISHAQLRSCVMSAGSPTNCKRTLSAVLRCAYDDGLLDERPMDRRIPVHRERREQAEPWTRFEAGAALEALRGAEPSVLSYAILGMSGLRREEALAVRPIDVREESTYSYVTGESVRTMVVDVRRTWTERGGLSERTKNDHSARTVPVLPSMRGDLARILAEGRVAAADEEAWAGSPIVDHAGRNWNRVWRAALESAGVRYIPPDMLRHTTDTLMLAAGVAPDVDDKIHGRSEHTSTYRNYFRPDVGVAEDAMRRMDCLLNVRPATGDSVTGRSADDTA